MRMKRIPRPKLLVFDASSDRRKPRLKGHESRVEPRHVNVAMQWHRVGNFEPCAQIPGSARGGETFQLKLSIKSLQRRNYFYPEEGQDGQRVGSAATRPMTVATRCA